MSAIDMLIKMKKQAKTDDLIVLMDEIIAYEKLSKIEAFRDLETSTAAAKKLPLLSAAHKGDIYCASMLEMARNIIIHMTGTAPPITNIPQKELTVREERMKDVMEQSIIQVKYRTLEEYRHATMEESVVAVFSEDREGKNSILIVVRDGICYDIYQGHYWEGNGISACSPMKPFVYKKDGYILAIETYSTLGNNAYPFATITTPDICYSVMFPVHDIIWLTPREGEQAVVKLSQEQITRLNMVKNDIHKFTECLVDIIRKNYLAEDAGEGRGSL